MDRSHESERIVCLHLPKITMFLLIITNMRTPPDGLSPFYGGSDSGSWRFSNRHEPCPSNGGSNVHAVWIRSQHVVKTAPTWINTAVMRKATKHPRKADGVDTEQCPTLSMRDVRMTGSFACTASRVPQLRPSIPRLLRINCSATM